MECIYDMKKRLPALTVHMQPNYSNGGVGFKMCCSLQLKPPCEWVTLTMAYVIASGLI